MRRGPKPAPTHLKLLRGNPSRNLDRLNLDEPQPDAIVEVPEPPACLSGVAADEWQVVAGQLIVMGTFSKVDLALLAAYCLSYGVWYGAAMALRDKPGLARNPHVAIASKAAADMIRLASEFGFSPAARTRINAGSSGAGRRPGKFDRFLSG
jgi:P27 family predicted phage terminase small subunit